MFRRSHSFRALLLALLALSALHVPALYAQFDP